MDGCCYHPKYLKTLFGQVSSRMTDFISLKLEIEKTKAKKIQQEYFYKYDTSLNGLMKNYPKLIDPYEFLKYVHNINYDCLEKDIALREELLKKHTEVKIKMGVSADRQTVFRVKCWDPPPAKKEVEKERKHLKKGKNNKRQLKNESRKIRAGRNES